MKFQWKILILFLTLALLPVITLRTFGVKALHRLGNELVLSSHDNLINETHSRLQLIVDGFSSVIWMGRERAEMALRYQAVMVEQALAGTPMVIDSPYFTSDFNAPDRSPADTFTSADHIRVGRGGRVQMLRVSRGQQAYNVAPSVEISQVREDLSRLDTLTPVYRDLYDHLEGFVLWHTTILDNGLTGTYPGHGNVPEKLDMREQPWFKETAGRQIPWSDPYVDPATRQVVMAASLPVFRPDGRFAGVTAFIVPISALLERQILTKNIPPETRSFLCYLMPHTETGERGARIIAKDDYTDIAHRRWDMLIEPDWIFSEDRSLFNAMLDDILAGRTGIRRMRYEGQDCLWAYGPTHTGGMLLLITPFQEVLNRADRAKNELETRIGELSRVTLVGVSIVLVLVVLLSVSFSRTITKPIQALVNGAKRLAEGQFNVRVDIRSRDEFGEMGKVFNMVGPQLMERYQMRQLLDLAMEVQQNLLPKSDPEIVGLDISGKSSYCDETGGDYYDFLDLNGKEEGKIGVVVGDVAGHGIPSALLMTTARALIRQRVSISGNPAEIVTDVNHQLVRDVEESGQFMTLFFGELDRKQMRFRWVRAGHDPAFIYDPDRDEFQDLTGEGLPLGVTETASYHEMERDVRSGQIIVIGTDGIRETVDTTGMMFGRNRLKDVIRDNAVLPAKEIVEAVIHAVDRFRHPMAPEDDVTLVVIKVKEM